MRRASVGRRATTTFSPSETTSGAKGTLVYSAKAHAALCDDDNKGDLVVTYCTNSTDLAGLVNDHTLYYPRFVRVFLVQPR